MTANGMRISYAEMQTTAGQLTTRRATIEAELDSVRRLVQGLIAQGFVTQHASARFGQATETFVASAKSLVSSLGEISGYLTTTAAAVEQVDRELAAKIVGHRG